MVGCINCCRNGQGQRSIVTLIKLEGNNDEHRCRGSQIGKDTAITLDPLDWMSRFLQHILPPYFARVRTFGWLHPAAKVHANCVRALLRAAPLLNAAEKAAWQPSNNPELSGLDDELSDPQPSTPNPQPVLCPHCRKAMRVTGRMG